MNDRPLLIIADVHLHHERAEEIITMVGNDCNVLFLGDYFDFFGDDVTMCRKTARWLRESVLKPNRFHLVGNHDPFYFTHGVSCWCPGNNSDKWRGVREYLTKDIWNKLLTHFWITPNFLATHAGLTCEYAHPIIPLGEYLDIQSKEFKTACEQSTYHNWFEMGSRRGNNKDAAGPLWCDWQYFKPIPFLHQICGHTARYIEPQIIQSTGSYNIMIDSANKGNGVQYPGGWAIYDKNIVMVFNKDGSLVQDINLTQI